MFGKPRKTMSNSGKFILAEGKRVGNLQPPKHNDPSTETAPAQRSGKSTRLELGTIKLHKGLK